MNEERTNSSLSGHSLVALMVPNQATVNDGDSSYATTEIQYIQEQIPDLRFIYYGGGSIQRFSSFVRDPSQDLFSLTYGSTVATSAGPVAKRIIQSKSNAMFFRINLLISALLSSSSARHQSPLWVELVHQQLGHRSDRPVCWAREGELLPNFCQLFLWNWIKPVFDYSVPEWRNIQHMYLAKLYMAPTKLNDQLYIKHNRADLHANKRKQL